MMIFQYYSKVVKRTRNEQKAIIKQLIVATLLLLIYDVQETIQYTRIILDFIMLIQYILYDDEILRYIKYALYKLEKTKIPFEYYRPIESKRCRPTFNYSEFDVINHFVQCIWDYGNAVNYNTSHNKVVHKYLLKAFYNRTNKKEYNSQIR